MVADTLLELNSLSNFLNYLLTSHFFHFGCLIWRKFAGVKNIIRRVIHASAKLCGGSEFWKQTHLFVN